MKVIIDTNAFIDCIGKKSPYRFVFGSFLNKYYSIFFTNSILLEYFEVFSPFWDHEVATNIIRILTNAENSSSGEVYFNFIW